VRTTALHWRGELLELLVRHLLHRGRPSRGRFPCASPGCGPELLRDSALSTFNSCSTASSTGRKPGRPGARARSIRRTFSGMEGRRRRRTGCPRGPWRRSPGPARGAGCHSSSWLFPYFRAPAVSPLIICFCSTMVMVNERDQRHHHHRAHLPPQDAPVLAEPGQDHGSVALVELVNSEANRNSVQVRKMQNRAVATMPGKARAAAPGT